VAGRTVLGLGGGQEELSGERDETLGPVSSAPGHRGQQDDGDLAFGAGLVPAVAVERGDRLRPETGTFLYGRGARPDRDEGSTHPDGCVGVVEEVEVPVGVAIVTAERSDHDQGSSVSQVEEWHGAAPPAAPSPRGQQQHVVADEPASDDSAREPVCDCVGAAEHAHGSDGEVAVGLPEHERQRGRAASASQAPTAYAGRMDLPEDRIAVFIDYENLAIGAREDLGGHQFVFKPISDALAERGRVVVRRAYADWTLFEGARRGLAEQQVELIEIPQRLGMSRKNAADIKMAVDAVELSLEREYITTFVIVTGDSDFTPLVHKLRELNKRVVGIGLRDSTSGLLPPACDEFLFYETLEGVELPTRRRASKPKAEVSQQPEREETPDLDRLVTQTLSGMQRSEGVVLASSLKRALIRKDPTFSEAEHGFRGFGELLRNLADRGVVELSEGPARGDPEVSFPSGGGKAEEAFRLLGDVVANAGKGEPVPLSGLKDRLRKSRPDFSEKSFGYGGFLQFCKAAAAGRYVSMEWSDEAEDYLLTP